MKCIISSTFLIVSITLSSFAQVTVNYPSQDVSVLNNRGVAEFNTSTFYGEPGQPSLPVYVCTVLLPPDADLKTVSFSVDGLVETKLPGKYEVLATEPWTNVKGWESWPKTRMIVDRKDVSVYSTNALFPQNHVTATEIGQLNCFKLVQVKVSQFRYNPVTKELFKVTMNNFKVNYTFDSGYRANKAATRIPLEYVSRLKRMAINVNEFMARYESDYTFVQKEILAILIPQADRDKLSNFDAFVEAKEAYTKYDVMVVTDDDWGGGTGSTAYDNIREWLQDNLQKRGLNYALIIGESDIDNSEAAMHYFPDYANWGSSYPEHHNHCETDWGYCQLTGDYKDDKIPELHVGRIPIYDNHSTVDEILQKTIDYFTAEPDDIKWRFNALLGGPGYNSGSQTSWAALNPAYHEFIEPYEPEWGAFRCYASSYGTPQEADLVASDISPTWKEGTYSIISWGAHGSTSSASSTMSSSKTANVGNDYPGFVMCGSCSNATISSSGNLSYSILKNCGMGAIGGTDYTVISGDLKWIKAFVGYLAVDSLTIGATHTELINNNCVTSWLNRAPYVLYGDPSVGVYTCKDPTQVSDFVQTQAAKTTMNANVLPGKSVRFSFTGIDKTAASLSIYSVNGVRINTITLKPGTKAYSWEGLNAAGAKVSAGLYIARLSVKSADASTVVADAKLVVK